MPNDQDFISQALKRFQQAAEAEDQWRADALDDLEFSTGNQWPLNIRNQRENGKNPRPCLTMDQTQQSIRLVSNEFRQTRPGINVNPVGDGADVDTAQILEGCVRHIEVNSEAEEAYDWAHESVLRACIGHWRILNDYADDDTDEQEIYIRKIRNPFSVYWQPDTDVEYADKRWCFVIVDVPWDTYRDEYGDSTLAKMSLENATATGNNAPEWVTKESVRVAEYFTLEIDSPAKKRPKRQVRWHKINAVEIIDQRDLPGSSIPILTCVGDDIDVNGRRYMAGLIRNAKEPQRFYNYASSGAAEALALAPKAPWVVVEGQLENREKEWENPNSYVLQYKQVDIAGKPAPPPQRNTAEPPIQAVSIMLQQASMNVKAAMGIYDPSLGQSTSSQESGVKVQRLQTQGSIATLNYTDNVARTMRRCGKLLLQWIAAIYDTPRVKRIIKPDGSVEQVVFHGGQESAAKKLAEQAGIKKIYDTSVGRYDVTISVGPSYQSKRQEAVDTQINLLKTLPPQAAGAIMDITARNMDIPQNEEIADRLKKLVMSLYPNLIDSDADDPKAMVQKLQGQLQQLGQQHVQLSQIAQEQSKIIDTKQVEQQGKIEVAKLQELSRQAIVKMQEATKLAVAQINASKDANQSFAETELETFSIMHDAAHEVAMDEKQKAHEKEMAAQGLLAAQQSQSSDQAHDAAMAAQNQPEEVGQNA